MPTVSDLTTRLDNLRRAEYHVINDTDLWATTPSVAINELKKIRAAARRISTQLRELGAIDEAWKAESGWSVIELDQVTEDEYDRWCEEQRAKEMCRLYGYDCGICHNCRQTSVDPS